LENSSKIPWEDLRYLFGEIMYGGHITDDWDRRLCRTFLQEWLQVTIDHYFIYFFQREPKFVVVGVKTQTMTESVKFSRAESRLSWFK
jgi:dynein heavy chain